VDGFYNSNRMYVYARVPSAVFVRPGVISLDTHCVIPSTDCWPNFKVEEAVSTLKIQKKVLLLYNEFQAGLCGDPKGDLACWKQVFGPGTVPGEGSLLPLLVVHQKPRRSTRSKL
jgi:hypothetical protein